MRTTVLLLVALTLATVSRMAHAQHDLPYLPNGAALGVSATRFSETLRLDESATAVTFRRSALRRNHAAGLVSEMVGIPRSPSRMV